jgi:hypothetical protein
MVAHQQCVCRRRQFMRILPPVEEEIRRVVRDERAKDPLISVARLEAALEKHFQRGFSHNYVSKIADKVAREGLIQADHRQIEDRMNFTRENPPDGSAFRCSSLEMVVFARPSARAMAPVDRPAARKTPIWSLSSSERCE